MKPLKFPSEDKAFDIFDKRLRSVEYEKNIDNEDEEESTELTESEMQRIFAKLRESRAKERYGPGPGGEHGYEDVDDEMTDFEVDWYSGKSKPEHMKISPELRYQKIKAIKYYRGHEKGCNNSTDICVPSCRLYPEFGRIEDEEVIAHYEEIKRNRDATTRDWKRSERARKTNRVFIYDPDTPNDGANSNPNLDKIIKKLIKEQLTIRRMNE